MRLQARGSAIQSVEERLSRLRMIPQLLRADAVMLFYAHRPSPPSHPDDEPEDEERWLGYKTAGPRRAVEGIVTTLETMDYAPIWAWFERSRRKPPASYAAAIVRAVLWMLAGVAGASLWWLVR